MQTVRVAHDCTVLFRTVSAVLSRTVLCFAGPCGPGLCRVSTVWSRTVLCCAGLCGPGLCCVVQDSVVLDCVVWCRTALRCTGLCCFAGL